MGRSRARSAGNQDEAAGGRVEEERALSRTRGATHPRGFPPPGAGRRGGPSEAAQQAGRGGEGRRGGSPLGCPAPQPKSPAAPRRSRSQTWRRLHNDQPVRRARPPKRAPETASAVSRNTRRRRRVPRALRYGRRWGPLRSAARRTPGRPPSCLMCRPHPRPGSRGARPGGGAEGSGRGFREAFADRHRRRQPAPWGARRGGAGWRRGGGARLRLPCLFGAEAAGRERVHSQVREDGRRLPFPCGNRENSAFVFAKSTREARVPGTVGWGMGRGRKCPACCVCLTRVSCVNSLTVGREASLPRNQHLLFQLPRRISCPCRVFHHLPANRNVCVRRVHLETDPTRGKSG